MAKAESMSLLQFQQTFPNEEACESYLVKQRWPDGFRCPHCQHDQFYPVRSRKLYECQQCGAQTSLTSGTIFHKTKTPLLQWFWAIYLVAHDKRGRSALSLTHVLDIHYRTAWRMLHKIRHAMGYQDARYLLSGLVEMDDAYFGSPKKSKHGRGTTKTKVAVALSTDEEGKPQFLRMQIIEKVTIEEIHRVAQTCVTKGATILSDGHSSYKQLQSIGYQHHSKNYYQENEDEFLKWIHTIISNAKAFIQGTYHGLSQAYLQAYLDEFCYRFNRRIFPNKLFSQLLNACLSGPPFKVA